MPFGEAIGLLHTQMQASGADNLHVVAEANRAKIVWLAHNVPEALLRASEEWHCAPRKTSMSEGPSQVDKAQKMCQLRCRKFSHEMTAVVH